jgi:hypothetical protein
MSGVRKKNDNGHNEDIERGSLVGQVLGAYGLLFLVLPTMHTFLGYLPE